MSLAVALPARFTRARMRRYVSGVGEGASMYDVVGNAMQSLADDRSVFGLENSQKGENDFQLALGRKLQDMTESDGWQWAFGPNEERFATETLPNEGAIKVDIVGRHPAKGMVAIELKYVTAADGAAPSNPPGFPYDVAKDCLRLDLLRFGYCRPMDRSVALADPYRLETYVIGLTNWSQFWGRYGALGGWAKDFARAVSAAEVRFDGLLKTSGRNPQKTIFKAKRCHIAFGRDWTGTWHPYVGQFRYLLLRPANVVESRWTHHHTFDVDEQSAVIPFLTDEARKEWLRQHELLWRSHHDKK